MSIDDTGDGIILTGCLAWLVTLFLSLAQLTPALPDFSSLDAPARKAEFINYLEPLVAEVNDRVRQDRQSIRALSEQLESQSRLSWLERFRLASLAEKYEIDDSAHAPEAVLSELDRRAGVIPKSLVLIQAAKESGWGTSRFATEGNNLFGQRCYESDCGIAPRGRKQPRFGLAQFSSVKAAIESYVLNLNTHEKYQKFRELRETLRNQDKPLRGLDLAAGLLGYSERGQAYIDEIRAMIRQNDLE